MENRNSKVIAIVALIVAVVGLGIGFAAFSSTLTISSSATVTPNSSSFNVGFSTKIDSLSPGTVQGTGMAEHHDATLTGTSITGIKASFTEPGQTAGYTFFVYNAGEYTAYLKQILFNNAPGATSNKKCTAGTGASDALVQEACNSISIKVIEVGYNAGKDVTSTVNSITGVSLLKNNGRVVRVEISYASDGARADGPFDVSFGDITFKYSTVD